MSVQQIRLPLDTIIPALKEKLSELPNVEIVLDAANGFTVKHKETACEAYVFIDRTNKVTVGTLKENTRELTMPNVFTGTAVDMLNIPNPKNHSLRKYIRVENVAGVDGVWYVNFKTPHVRFIPFTLRICVMLVSEVFRG